MILAQTLPLTVLLIILESTVGGMLALLVTDFEGRVSNGFLVTSGAILGVGAGIAFLLRFGYGDAASSLNPFLLALTVLLFAYALVIAFGWRLLGRLIGVGSLVAGAVVLIRSVALEPHFAGSLDLISLALATLVLGTALTALLLGHWYLVTPLLSARSLRRITEILLVGLGLQLLLDVTLFLPGGDPAVVAQRMGLVLSTYGFVFWFRVIVGLAAPIVLGILTWRSCGDRAMQTATGLLYIVFGCVLAGEAAARVLHFLASVSL